VPTLEADGYLVVRGAVPRLMCERVVEAIGSQLGIGVDDPATWHLVSSEVDQVPLWGHQSQWDIRELPSLHAGWAGIWGTEALWVDMASCRFTPPWRPGRADALPIHWDNDPRVEHPRWYAGVLALTDAPAGHGGFRCAPALTHDRDRWPTEWTQTQYGTEYRPLVHSSEIVDVPLAAGDLVILHPQLAHGTVRNEGDSPRVAFYIQFFPEGDDDARRERVDDYANGRCPSFWRWKPGHDRIEPGPPARLTPHGRKLLGLDRWAGS
jgi:hypothetical protein